MRHLGPSRRDRPGGSRRGLRPGVAGVEGLEDRRLMAVAIHEFPIPTPASHPSFIATGPDGDLYFTETVADRIGRLDPKTGAIAEFRVPTVNGSPLGIATGSDGNVWFTEDRAGKIGRLNPGTGAIKEFAIPTPHSGPIAITAGPGGDLFFAEQAGKIGRIVPKTGAITEYAEPAPAGNLQGIAAGRDGNLYVTDATNDDVVQFDPKTHAFQFAPIPTPDAGPGAIAAGPGGFLFFTEADGNAIGRLDPLTGDIGEAPIPTASSAPQGITAGLDGFVWFAEGNGNKLGRVDPNTGAIVETAVPTAHSDPTGITTGPDGNLWFVETLGNKIGRAVIPVVTTTSLVLAPSPAVSGQGLIVSAVVAGPTAGNPPTGRVTFTIDGKALPPVPLSVARGRGVATITTAPLAAGPHTIRATYGGGAGFAASAATRTVVASPAPTLVAVRRYGVHAQPTTLALIFSTPLDAARARDARNYRIVAPNGRDIAVDSASYDPATRTVTLRPHSGLDVHKLYRLTVIATGPGGVASVAGVPLAGVGLSGTAAVAIVGPRNLVLPGHPAHRS